MQPLSQKKRPHELDETKRASNEASQILLTHEAQACAQKALRGLEDKDQIIRDRIEQISRWRQMEPFSNHKELIQVTQNPLFDLERVYLEKALEYIPPYAVDGFFSGVVSGSRFQKLRTLVGIGKMSMDSLKEGQLTHAWKDEELGVLSSFAITFNSSSGSPNLEIFIKCEQLSKRPLNRLAKSIHRMYGLISSGSKVGAFSPVCDRALSDLTFPLKIRASMDEHLVPPFDTIIQYGSRSLKPKYAALGFLFEGNIKKIFFSVPEILRILYQVNHALKCLASKDKVHSDLTLPNVLRYSQNYYLGDYDFGITRGLESNAGTHETAAPEVYIKPCVAEFSRDTYSLGIMGWQLLGIELTSEYLGYKRKQNQGLLEHFATRFRAEVEGRCGKEGLEIKVFDLCQSLASFNPAARPDHETIRQRIELLRDEYNPYFSLL